MRKTRIVADVGQNHNGSIENAKTLVKLAKKAGCDYVKFIKRYIPNELTEETYKMEYDSPNAFKKYYGEHRKFLEFSKWKMKQLIKYAEKIGMPWFSTVCDRVSFGTMKELGNSVIKIPSKEITNIPFLRYIQRWAENPVQLSTGLATKNTLSDALHILGHKMDVLYYCVSEYPTKAAHMDLKRIKYFTDTYGGWFDMGLSSHYPGIEDALYAVSNGATWIEKHLTMNREMKGTDQKVALTFDQMNRLVSSVRKIEVMKGTYNFRTELEDYLKPAAEKLMKTKQEDGIYRT